MVKFLIIRFSSIGDIVLTTPVIRCLKSQVEDAEVHYLTKNEYKNLLSANPYIDKIHILKGKLSDTIEELHQEDYDYIIDLHRNIRTYFIKNRLKSISFSFNKLNYKKWLLVNFKINKLPDTHIVDRYFETIKVFDVKNDNKGLDYFIPTEENVELSELPDNFHNGYIAFVTGAKHYTKRLTADKIISVCKNIELPVLLLGGQEEKEEGDIIQSKAGSSVYNACGAYNINQSASLIKKARVVITHDTGLMHIAAAFNKVIISIWGNTIPQFGMYPYISEKKYIIIEVEDLKCRPCSKLGYIKCPKMHFRCIKEIDEERIVKYAREYFGN